tara:strand:- start:649 stop:912 length:264 start_codon:yes stop_codon:yes gene_type:complete
MEMYERELSNNQLNKIFYNESSETKEIENNSFTNYKVWEKNCLRNYDDCKSLGYKSKLSREDFKEEMKQIIMRQLYRTYERGMRFIL